MAAAPSFLAPPFPRPRPNPPSLSNKDLFTLAPGLKGESDSLGESAYGLRQPRVPPKLTSFQTSADEVSCHQGARLRVQD